MEGTHNPTKIASSLLSIKNQRTTDTANPIKDANNIRYTKLAFFKNSTPYFFKIIYIEMDYNTGKEIYSIPIILIIVELY